MTSLHQAWEALRDDDTRDAEHVRYRLAEINTCQVFAARRLLDDLEAVVLEVATRSIDGGVQFPRPSEGFEVRSEPVVPGPSGRTRFILQLAKSDYRDVFHTLAEDVVTRLSMVSTESQAVRQLAIRLTRWQSFLRKYQTDGLSPEQRRGLFGELLLIRDRLLHICLSDRAVQAWKGCHGANHDFQFASGSIEVKTTKASTPHAFHVSNVLQLDDSTVSQLFVFLVMVEESDGGDESLPGLVDSLRAILDGESRMLFDDCLVDAGFLDCHRGLYATPRYSLRSTRLFEVRDGFPRLLESQLPAGVENVRYQVALAACTAFQCQDEETVFRFLSAETRRDE